MRSQVSSRAADAQGLCHGALHNAVACSGVTDKSSIMHFLYLRKQCISFGSLGKVTCCWFATGAFATSLDPLLLNAKHMSY